MSLRKFSQFSTANNQTFLALLFFFVMTAIFLRPVVFNFFDQVSGSGDTYEYVWRLWWFKHTLLDTAQSPWLVPFVYYPQGYLLAHSEVTPVNTIFGIPLTLAFGEYSAHNALLFLAVFLTGFNTFLLARQLTGNVWAALLAGILFGFAPYRRGQYFHLNQMSVQWFPLIFLFGERFLQTGQRRQALAAGVAFGLSALSSWYHALAAVVLVLVWFVMRARPWSHYLKRPQLWRGLAIASLVSLGLVLPFLPPFVAISQDPATRPPLDNVNFWSASPTDYLIPNPFHPIWGGWIEEKLIPLATLVDKESPTQADFEAGNFFPNSNLNISTEFLVSPGLIALLFAIYGLRWGPSAATRPWLYLVITAVLLSLGPTLHIAGRQLVIPAPQAIVDLYNDTMNYIALNLSLQSEPFTIGSNNGLLIPLPALWLRWFTPLMGGVRNWARFGQFAIFGFAILAAYGATAWYHREIRGASSQKVEANLAFAPRGDAPYGRSAPLPRTIELSNIGYLKPAGVWLILIGLALFELWWTPMPTHPPMAERPVDRWLRQQPGPGAIIQYPLESGFSGVQFVYTRAHGRPIAHGYGGSSFSFMFGRRQPELLNFPNPASLKQLSQQQVRYVLIETEGPGASEAQTLLKKAAMVPCLHPATVQASVHVFELVNCIDPARSEIGSSQVFHRR